MMMGSGRFDPYHGPFSDAGVVLFTETFRDFHQPPKKRELIPFKPKIIGLTGRARSGKDSVGGMLRNTFGFKTLAFADPIRQMLAAGLGLTPGHFEGKLKEEVIDWLGKSPRQLMQTLGTEWGRSLISPTIWLDIAERKTLQYNADRFNVVITDVRFDNEASLIRKMGGEVWHIYRPGQAINDSAHVSEAGVTFCTEDRRIDNDGSLADLFNEVEDAI